MGDFDLEKAIEVAIKATGGVVSERGARVRVSLIGFKWRGYEYKLYLTRSSKDLLKEIRELVNKNSLESKTC